MDVFRYAPAPITVDGFVAVPIHITHISANMVFDGSSKTTHCTAEMQFNIGPDSGYPYFDLRQSIDTAQLDGSSLSVADVAHHDFGGGANAELRIIHQWLAAGSAHTLALDYNVSTPNAPSARSIHWESGSARLSFDFYLSDLNAGRYLESWLPANLLFDNFPVQLEIQIANSSHPHSLLSNGDVNDLGSNHWRVDFPSHFLSCSPMLLIEATDRVETYNTTITLAGGVDVQLQLMKMQSDTNLQLTNAAVTLSNYLNEFHNSVGNYQHANRFVAYLTSGYTHSMEYNGGTTSRMTALKHEVYHSWWARGLVPARGEDGWLDEAWTTYNTQNGGPNAQPMDMSDAPVALWENNAFKRETHDSSYGHGADVFSALASELGISDLLGYMSDIYQRRIDRRFTTPEIEAELIRRSSRLSIARYFDRFVYGFGNAAPGSQPDLYLRDAPDDTGNTLYTGTFWLSPDVWVRNNDDDGSTPQNPESGQDNWFYARVHNRGNATARSFVVGFKINLWAGTEFVYPGDWFPLTAAVVGFDLSAGDSQIVKARWPKEDIPAVGSHGCLVALVYHSDDIPSAAAHVWQHNNLAQRNLTVVNGIADKWLEVNFRLGSPFTRGTQSHRLELIRPKRWTRIKAVVTHKRATVVSDLFHSPSKLELSELEVRPDQAVQRFPMSDVIQLKRGALSLKPAKGSTLQFLSGGKLPVYRIPTRAQLIQFDRNKLAIQFDEGRRASFPIVLLPGRPQFLRLRIKVPATVRAGETIRIDLIQRDQRQRILGGFSLAIHVNQKKELYHERARHLF